MAITQFIPLNKRTQNKDLIEQIINSVYGTQSAIDFTEMYVPEGGKVTRYGISFFNQFLCNQVKLLWAVYNDDEKKNVIGFILISDSPHTNSIGFGINHAYAKQGIMTRAWNEIYKEDPGIQYPLNAYTSKRNTAALKLLESCGFENTGNIISFCGETSFHFIRN